MSAPAMAAMEEGAEPGSRAELGEMADILPLPPPPAAVPWPPLAGALVVALVVAVVAVRHLNHPLGRLGRRLRAGRISPREAAHVLARHAGAGASRRRLDALRFGRQGPDADQVLGLLEEVRRGR